VKAEYRKNLLIFPEQGSVAKAGSSWLINLRTAPASADERP